MELLFINEKFHQLKKKETNKQISTTKTKQKLKLYSIYIYIIHIIQIVQIYIPEFEGRLTFLIALDILFKNLSP